MEQRHPMRLRVALRVRAEGISDEQRIAGLPNAAQAGIAFAQRRCGGCAVKRYLDLVCPGGLADRQLMRPPIGGGHFQVDRRVALESRVRGHGQSLRLASAVDRKIVIKSLAFGAKDGGEDVGKGAQAVQRAAPPGARRAAAVRTLAERSAGV